MYYGYEDYDCIHDESAMDYEPDYDREYEEKRERELFPECFE